MYQSNQIPYKIFREYGFFNSSNFLIKGSVGSISEAIIKLFKA